MSFADQRCAPPSLAASIARLVAGCLFLLALAHPLTYSPAHFLSHFLQSGNVYIWNTTTIYSTPAVFGRKGRQDKNGSYECFKATHEVDDEAGQPLPGIATAAVFAPFKAVSVAAAVSNVHQLYPDLEILYNSIICVSDYTGESSSNEMTELSEL